MDKPIRPARVLTPLGLAVCLSLYGDLALYAVLATQLEVVGLTLGALGVMLSVNRLVRIPTNPLIGVLSDRWGRRRLFLLGMLLGVLTTASYGLVRGFWPFLAARVTWGIAWTLINVGGFSMVLDISTPSTRGRLTGTYTTWKQIGFALGPLLGGLLVDKIGFRPAMWVGACLTGAGFLVALVALPETGRPAPPERSLQASAAVPWRDRLQRLGRRLGRLPSSNPDLILASGLFLTVLFAGEGIALSTVGVLLQERFGQQVEAGGMVLGVAFASGLLLATRALVVSATGPVAGRLSDLLADRRPVVRASLVVGATGAGLLALGGSVWTVVAGVVLGAISAGAALAALAAWVGDMTPAGQQGMVMGFYATVGDIGSMTGPALAFALLPVVGLEPVYLICAGTLLSGMIILSRASGGKRDRCTRDQSKEPGKGSSDCHDR